VGIDPSPLRGADKNIVLSPGQKADQHYPELVPTRNITIPRGIV